MGEPIVFFREGFVNAVVEVLVVGKNDMAAHIVKLKMCESSVWRFWCSRLTKPSLVTSVEARPPGVSLESMIIHEGPFCEKSARSLQHVQPDLQSGSVSSPHRVQLGRLQSPEYLQI